MLGVKLFFFVFFWQEYLWPRNVVKMMDGNHMGGVGDRVPTIEC